MIKHMFIISEIGVNWEGNVELLRQMIQQSKNAGADAVKFQAFTEDILGQHPKKTILLKSSISNENIENINSICSDVGIEWICTPMYPDAVDMLQPYVKRYKIRTADGIPIINKNFLLFFTKSGLSPTLSARLKCEYGRSEDPPIRVV